MNSKDNKCKILLTDKVDVEIEKVTKDLFFIYNTVVIDYDPPFTCYDGTEIP